MAITEVGTPQSGTIALGVVPRTVNYTTPSGAELFVGRWGGDADAGNAADEATLNGISLTVFSIGSFRSVGIGYLLNPPSGTNVFAVTTGQAGNQLAIGYLLNSFSGVDTTTPVTDGQVSDVGTNTSHTVTVSTASGELVLDSLMIRTNTPLTPGADQTEEIDIPFSADVRRFGASRQDGANGGVMSWTWGPNVSQRYIAAISIAPAAGGGTVTANPATATWQGVTVVASPGSVQLSVGPAVGTWQGMTVGVDADNLVQVNPALGLWSAVAPGLVIGGVSAVAGPALGTWQGVTVTPSTPGGQNVTANPATGRWLGVGLTAVPGALSQSVGPAQGRWDGVGVGVTAGPQTISVGSAVGRWLGVAVGITTGAAVKAVNSAVGRWLAERLPPPEPQGRTGWLSGIAHRFNRPSEKD